MIDLADPQTDIMRLFWSFKRFVKKHPHDYGFDGVNFQNGTVDYWFYGTKKGTARPDVSEIQLGQILLKIWCKANLIKQMTFKDSKYWVNSFRFVK